MSRAAPRPTKAASRYWRGKPGAADSLKGSRDPEAAADDDDSDLSSDDQGDARGVGRKSKQSEADKAKREGIQIVGDLGTTSTKAEDEPRGGAARARPAVKSEEDKHDDLDDEQEVEEDEESEEEESSEEDESSEEEEPPKPLYKPVFVSKRQRDPEVLKKAAAAKGEEADQEELKREQALEEERQKSHKLVSQTVSKEMQEKEAQDTFPECDDTDGIDPTAEFEAWRIRELQRLKRDADARQAREQEKEELEARRAMPEHLRLKEDTDRANASRSQARGTQAFLSKYHHAGVFYSEDERTRELLERERKNAVTMEDQVQDVASLPKMMQVRDYGKRSRTKHTHLRDVDTTQQDAGWAKGGGSASAGGNACFNCGQPGHVKRDCPELAASSSRGPPRQRDEGYRERDSDRRRKDGWGRHDDVRDRRPRSRSRSRSPPPRRRRYSRSRSKSRSPPRYSRGTTRRDRSRSRERYASDKRRRYD